MSNSAITGSSWNHRIPEELLKETNFSNVETWRLALWFEMNPDVKRMVRKTSYYIGASEIERWCYKLWASGQTPDGVILNNVDWAEIDALWSAQSKKMFDKTQKLLDFRYFKKWHEC